MKHTSTTLHQQEQYENIKTLSKKQQGFTDELRKKVKNPRRTLYLPLITTSCPLQIKLPKYPVHRLHTKICYVKISLEPRFIK